MKNLETYTIEDYLADDSFVEWATGTADNAWEQAIEKYPAQKEKIDIAKKMVRNIRFEQNPMAIQMTDQIWSRINQTISLPSHNKWRIPIKYIYLVASAASVALLILVLRPHNHNITLEIAGEYRLPSESLVTLEEDSYVTYEDGNWEKQRIVKLTGQAAFDVTKTGSDFIVESTHGTVKVLGTQFIVHDKADQFYVKVNEGRVQVNRKNYEQILKPGEAYLYNPISNGSLYELISNQSIKATLEFKNQTLETIVPVIEAFYGIEVQITLQELLKLSFTGFINSSLDLESSLSDLVWPLNLKYAITDKKVVLYK